MFWSIPTCPFHPKHLSNSQNEGSQCYQYRRTGPLKRPGGGYARRLHFSSSHLHGMDDYSVLMNTTTLCMVFRFTLALGGLRWFLTDSFSCVFAQIIVLNHKNVFEAMSQNVWNWQQCDFTLYWFEIEQMGPEQIGVDHLEHFLQLQTARKWITNVAHLDSLRCCDSPLWHVTQYIYSLIHELNCAW